MHPRSIYRDPVDFSLLAQDLVGRSQIDFHDPNAVRELTASLLRRDFGLAIDLPEDRLCPRVPNRLNYILWLQDLLDSTSGRPTDIYDPTREIMGLDIGVGSSCIYPLLGCSTRSSWSFIGTDIDEKNLRYARNNISRNNLNDRIRVFESPSPDSPLIDLDRMRVDNITFTMCNPPFYSTTSELLSSSLAKSLPPLSACTGTPIEMVTPGGEVFFVTRMISESLVLRKRVQWYTCMLGKLSSLSAIISKLKEVGIRNWAVGRFVQNSATVGGDDGSGGPRNVKRSTVRGARRWAIAWSFHPWRPSKAAVMPFPLSPSLRGLTPFPTEYFINIPLRPHPTQQGTPTTAITIASISTTITSLLILIPIPSFTIHTNTPEIFIANGSVRGNIWSRAARRARAKAVQAAAAGEGNITCGEAPICKQGDIEKDEEEEMRFRILVSIPVPEPSSSAPPSIHPEEMDMDADADEDQDEAFDSNSHTQSNSHTYSPLKLKHAPTLTPTIQITVRHAAGHDTVLFESFCGMLRRGVLAGVAGGGRESA